MNFQTEQSPTKTITNKGDLCQTTVHTPLTFKNHTLLIELADLDVELSDASLISLVKTIQVRHQLPSCRFKY